MMTVAFLSGVLLGFLWGYDRALRHTADLFKKTDLTREFSDLLICARDRYEERERK